MNQQIEKGDTFFVPGGGTVEVQSVSGYPNSDDKVDVFFVGAKVGISKALMVATGFAPSTNGQPDFYKYNRKWGLQKKCNVSLKSTQVLLEFNTEEQAREFKSYMCDGGGEQGLEYVEELQGLDFDYWNDEWNYLPQRKAKL